MLLFEHDGAHGAADNDDRPYNCVDRYLQRCQRIIPQSVSREGVDVKIQVIALHEQHERAGKDKRGDYVERLAAQEQQDREYKRGERESEQSVVADKVRYGKPTFVRIIYEYIDRPENKYGERSGESEEKGGKKLFSDLVSTRPSRLLLGCDFYVLILHF